MSLESQLVAVIGPLCAARVFPDLAPLSTVKPYVTYQAIGGRSLRWLDKSAADKRHTSMQINVWGKGRIEVNTLMRAIEDALCAATTFTAMPDGEPISTHDDINLTDAPQGIYSASQDFSIYSYR